MKRTHLTALLALVPLLPSCVGTNIGRQSLGTLRTEISVDAPLEVQMGAAAGERLFVRGAMYEVPCLATAQDHSSKMNGFLGIDFDYSVKASTMRLAFQTDQHLYYVAPRNLVSAEYNGTSVLAEEDQVGVRESKTGGRLEWFVDNTIHNNRGGAPGDWIWHRTVTTAEESSIERTTGQFLDDSGDWVAFYYAGFFDDKVHFELEESSAGEQGPRRAFKFNLSDEGPTRIAIKGFKLDILSVDSEQLTYQWVSID